MINQCDGCRRGLPLVDGIHHGPVGYDMIGCTKDRYEGPAVNQLTAAPISRERAEYFLHLYFHNTEEARRNLSLARQLRDYGSEPERVRPLVCQAQVAWRFAKMVRGIPEFPRHLLP